MKLQVYTIQSLDQIFPMTTVRSVDDMLGWSMDHFSYQYRDIFFWLRDIIHET